MSRTVTITGGSGFLGQLLRRSLAAEGWRVDVYDRFRGPLVDLMRRRYLASATSSSARRAARAIRTVQSRTEPALIRARVVRPRDDDILAPRDHLAARFAGRDAVIHLAGIPHPHWPGASENDFVRMNYDAAVNVFEAARDAGCPEARHSSRLGAGNTMRVALTGLSEKTPNEFAHEIAASRDLIGLQTTGNSP